MLKNLNIRPVTQNDLGELLSWRNDLSVRNFMFTRHKIKPEEHEAWFENARQDTTRHLLIIEESGASFGYVQFSNADEGSVADWGFYTKPNAPKGSGKKLGLVSLNYAFENLKIHKAAGQAIESNIASASLHRRLGFKEEGTLRDHVKIENEYHSLICFGLLKHEWQASTKLGTEL